MDLNQRTLKSLEWERLKRFLFNECSTAESKDMALNLPLLENEAEILHLLEQENEALSLLSNSQDFCQQGLPDLRGHLQRLNAGACISAKEFLDLKRLLEMTKRLAAGLQALDPLEFPKLSQLQKRLKSPAALADAIASVLDDEGLVKDEASRALSKLRKDLSRLNQQIKDELLRIINSASLSRCLQEALFTVRNGRHVLPVLAHMRQSIPGIVHDSSSSGLTVYIEPLKVVELGNSLRLTEVEIERELERLLSELSRAASKYLPELESSYQALIEADLIFAKARLALKYRGSKPEIMSSCRLKLKNAKHPLLILQSSFEDVVGNDIYMNKELSTLMLTGPNTGGKTVYLKTAGLLSLMLKAGLLLPVEPGSASGIFSSVFADIGDEQSLEQNLSTFSSHMSNIVEITNQADASSLVLLDEIGVGTDPREGVALASVILSRLNNLGAMTICSTHYSQLKALAHSRPGFANASMDFDQESLKPLYRLCPGATGNSMAVVVARRLGLPEDLVNEAIDLLEESKDENAARVEELEDRIRRLKLQEEELGKLNQNLKLKEADLLSREENLSLKENLARSQAAELFGSEYKTARKMIAELTAKLQKGTSLQEIEEIRQEIETIKDALPEENEARSKQDSGKEQVFHTGQTVRLAQLGKTGQISELDSEQNARVLVGRVTVKVPLSQLEPVQSSPRTKSSGKAKGQQAKAIKPERVYTPKDPVFVRTLSNTLDLRGQRVEPGIELLKRFVDSCYLAQISPLMIIHGHGTGAMKTAVREFLDSCNYANSSRSGESYEGGDGVTVVNFH